MKIMVKTQKKQGIYSQRQRTMWMVNPSSYPVYKKVVIKVKQLSHVKNTKVIHVTCKYKLLLSWFGGDFGLGR